MLAKIQARGQEDGMGASKYGLLTPCDRHSLRLAGLRGEAEGRTLVPGRGGPAGRPCSGLRAAALQPKKTRETPEDLSFYIGTDRR